jgi:hypothetical protein
MCECALIMIVLLTDTTYRSFLNPDRKVWKEGGTAGLLQWLRDRL